MCKRCLRVKTKATGRIKKISHIHTRMAKKKKAASKKKSSAKKKR